MLASKYVGIGLYTIPAAARLIKLPSKTLHRWIEGYSWNYQGQRRTSPPKCASEVLNETGAIAFLDLIEARLIGKLRNMGVGWKAIFESSAAAKKRFNVMHPFASLQLKTDGAKVFREVADETGDARLEEIVSTQSHFVPIVQPLLQDLKFDEDDLAESWWPLGKSREVILDPTRSFGKPIVDSFGVPTSILAAAFKAEGSAERAADWYSVSVKAVEDAVEFEHQLAA